MNRYFIYHLTPSTRPGKMWDKKPLLKEGFTVNDLEPCGVALARLGSNQALGLYFTEDMHKFFYDLDGCRNPETGELNDVARQATELFAGAYIEISVSGTGIHIVGSYSGPRPNHSCRNDDVGIEMYTAGRGMAMGTPIPSSGSMDMDCTGAFLGTLDKYFKPKSESAPIEWRDGHELGWIIPDNDQLIEAAKNFRLNENQAFGRKAAFVDLWTRDVSRLSKSFPDNVSGRKFDESSADMALCSWIAWLTGNDCPRIAELMWKSGLVRDKWEKHRSYLERTIRRSLVKNGEFYKPKGVVPVPPKKATGKFIQNSSEVPLEKITWLWKNWLPRGKLTLYAGPGGVGKSTVSFNLAAIISRGGQWPDGTTLEAPGDVLIWSAEDDPADTIRPRLAAMGANSDRIHFIGTNRDENGNLITFDPSKDIVELKQQIDDAKLKVALIIIDPIVNVVAGDLNKANEVRRALQAIVDLALELDACVLGITHFTKSSSGKNPTERVLGSQAFTALSRMTIVGTKDEETGECVLLRTKSNISVDTGGFKYRIEPITLPGGFETTMITWKGAVEGSTRDILRDLEPDGEGKKGYKNEGVESYLELILKDGPRSIEEITEGAACSTATLYRAKAKLKIYKKEVDGVNCWALPLTPPEK